MRPEHTLRKFIRKTLREMSDVPAASQGDAPPGWSHGPGRRGYIYGRRGWQLRLSQTGDGWMMSGTSPKGEFVEKGPFKSPYDAAKANPARSGMLGKFRL